MLTVMQERYEAEYEQKVHEIQEQYDKKIEHGIKEDTANKFESVMSDFLKRKIDLYRTELEAVAEQLKELAGKLDAMDSVPNPFEGDELFNDGNLV